MWHRAGGPGAAALHGDRPLHWTEVEVFPTENWKQEDPELVSRLAYFSGCVVNHLEYRESCPQGVPIDREE